MKVLLYILGITIAVIYLISSTSVAHAATCTQHLGQLCGQTHNKNYGCCADNYTCSQSAPNQPGFCQCTIAQGTSCTGNAQCCGDQVCDQTHFGGKQCRDKCLPLGNSCSGTTDQCCPSSQGDVVCDAQGVCAVPTPTPTPQSCFYDSACPAGTFCGSPNFQDCQGTSENDCTCKTQVPPGSSCTSDDQCGGNSSFCSNSSGSDCLNGDKNCICSSSCLFHGTVTNCPTGDFCADTKDHQACQGGTSKACTCEKQTTSGSCTSDNQCASGYYCSNSSGGDCLNGDKNCTCTLNTSLTPSSGPTSEPTLGPPPPPPCAKEGQEPCKSFDTAFGTISTSPTGFVQDIVEVLLGISGGIALLLIIQAGYKLLTSQGKPEPLQQAREQLIAAIVGLLFIIFSFVLLQIITVDIFRIPGFQ